MNLHNLKTDAQAVGLNRETIAHLTMLHDLAVSSNRNLAWEHFWNAANTLECCTPMDSPAFNFYMNLKQAIHNR